MEIKEGIKNIVFEDAVIVIAMIIILIGLILGVFMVSHIKVDREWIDTLEGSKVLGAHVHFLLEAFLLFFLALLFKKRELGNIDHIKKVGFVLIIFGMIFHPLGLIGIGYNIEILRKWITPAEYSLIGGLIILIFTFIISKSKIE